MTSAFCLSNRVKTGVLMLVSTPASMALKGAVLMVSVAAVMSGCDTEEAPTPVPWSYVQDEVLIPSCGFSSCHGVSSGGLTLNAEKSYTELLDEPSSEIPEMMRVVPGDPDSSYLMWKLEGRDGIIDDPMPPGGALDEVRLAAVRQWIEEGAQP